MPLLHTPTEEPDLLTPSIVQPHPRGRNKPPHQAADTTRTFSTSCRVVEYSALGA